MMRLSVQVVDEEQHRLVDARLLEGLFRFLGAVYHPVREVDGDLEVARTLLVGVDEIVQILDGLGLFEDALVSTARRKLDKHLDRVRVRAVGLATRGQLAPQTLPLILDFLNKIRSIFPINLIFQINPKNYDLMNLGVA